MDFTRFFLDSFLQNTFSLLFLNIGYRILQNINVQTFSLNTFEEYSSEIAWPEFNVASRKSFKMNFSK